MTITLSNLSSASAQEVFDQVATHLLTQLQRSVGWDDREGEHCRYRGERLPNGQRLSCAAGCLISDVEYDESLERNVWLDLITANRVPRAHYNLIDDLQGIHDTEQPAIWSERLRHIAKRNNLSPTVVDQLSPKN